VTTRLQGRRALITGGASGIGAATAELFAAEGAAVVIADLSSHRAAAEALLERIEKDGGCAAFAPTDVTDPAAVDAAVALCVDRFGGIDAVVASAGVSAHPARTGSFNSLLDLDPEHFRFVLDVNVTGVFLTASAAASAMPESGGSIVVLASIAAKRPTAGAYSVSKAGAWMLTRCLAHELAPRHIRVNAIGPGYVATGLLDGMARRSGGDDADARKMWREAREKQVPLQRLGLPAEIARTALFLTSDEGSYFTGSLLHPDGGFASEYAGG
jgi:NAD(P)-dependent dehydrogenase (short-subunit alcohol dehydrogenase family)